MKWERSLILRLVQGAVLLAVFALLLVASLSAPLIHIGYLRITFSGKTVLLGNFGYCSASSCSRWQVGYDIAGALNNTFNLPKEQRVGGWVNDFTKGLIATPIIAGIAGIAALTSILGRSVWSQLWTTLLGIVTFFLCIGLVVYNCFFWSKLKNEALARSAWDRVEYGLPFQFVIAACAASIFAPLVGLSEYLVGKYRAWKRGEEYVQVGLDRGKTRRTRARESTYKTADDYEMPQFLEVGGQRSRPALFDERQAQAANRPTGIRQGMFDIWGKR